MEELIKQIQILVSEELKRANEKFSPFNSTHEGYAVLLEEVEEMQDDLNGIHRNIKILWGGIKSDNTIDELREICEYIKILSEMLAAEAIQVTAMSQKFLDMLERLESEKNESKGY